MVSADGSPLTVRQAFVRTVAFPLSALLFGIGFLMILVQREHRALHDLIAGTCSVYDWGERAAEMPGPLSAFLARQGTEPDEVTRKGGFSTPCRGASVPRAHPVPRGRKHIMIVLGLILLIIGLVASIPILTTIGAILLIVGLVLNLVPIGGTRRRVY